MSIRKQWFVCTHLLLAWILFSVSGCAEVGNSKIKDIQLEQLKGMTKTQLVEQYGPPSLRTLAYKDGVTTEQCNWSYASVAFGTIESTAFSVTFDDKGGVVSVTQNNPNPKQ